MSVIGIFRQSSYGRSVLLSDSTYSPFAYSNVT